MGDLRRWGGLVALCLVLAGAAPVGRAATPAGQEFDVSDCMWDANAQYDGASDGFGGIDVNAYYALTYPAAHMTGAHWRFRGEYPRARYFGFQTYDEFAGGIDALPDRIMVPDPGSANPYGGATWQAGQVAYTFDLLDVAPDQRASPHPGDVLYGGYRADSGTSVRRDAIEYRIYVPDRSDRRPGIKPGGVGLPRVFYVIDDPLSAQFHTHDEVCMFQHNGATFRGLSVGDVLFRALDGPLQSTQLPPAPATSPPQWLMSSRSNKTYPYLNQETGYLLGFIDSFWGEVLALRFRLPTVPPVDGEPGITDGPGRPQLRYWSMCTVQAVNFFNTDDCLHDHDVDRNADGTVTIAIANTRPVVDGVPFRNWMRFPGGTGFLFVRQIAPDAVTFPESVYFAASTVDDTLVRAWSGAYYPFGTYCSLPMFERTRCGF
jgi:hypothetical protein